MPLKKPETKFKENVVAPRLHTLPNCWFKKIQSVGIRGIPDYLINANGYFVAWELKKDAFEQADPLQRRNIARIKRTRGVARLVSPENFEECFAELAALCFGPPARKPQT